MEGADTITIGEVIDKIIAYFACFGSGSLDTLVEKNPGPKDSLLPPLKGKSQPKQGKKKRVEILTNPLPLTSSQHYDLEIEFSRFFHPSNYFPKYKTAFKRLVECTVETEKVYKRIAKKIDDCPFNGALLAAFNDVVSYIARQYTMMDVMRVVFRGTAPDYSPTAPEVGSMTMPWVTFVPGPKLAKETDAERNSSPSELQAYRKVFRKHSMYNNVDVANAPFSSRTHLELALEEGPVYNTRIEGLILNKLPIGRFEGAVDSLLKLPADIHDNLSEFEADLDWASEQPPIGGLDGHGQLRLEDL